MYTQITSTSLQLCNDKESETGFGLSPHPHLCCRPAPGHVDTSGDWNHGQHLADRGSRPQVGKHLQ